jgi:hypothetical protein
VRRDWAAIIEKLNRSRSGELRITKSALERNVSRGFQTAGFPGSSCVSK